MTTLTAAKTILPANCTTFQSYVGAAANPIAMATIAQICVNVQAIRYTSNPAFTPTAALGVPVASGQCFQYSGPIQNLQMIQVAATAVVDIELFQ